MGLGWYRGGSKLVAFNLHRNITTTNVGIRRTNHPLFHTFSKSYPRCSGVVHEGQLSPFVSGVARRYYRVDLSWVLNYPNTTIMVIIGSAVLISIYKGFETVPFTNRSHFISWLDRLEKPIGHILFEDWKALLYKGKTLPATHPESVRVTLIAKNIINSLHTRKDKEEDEENEAWIDVAYASHIPKPVNYTISWFKILMTLISFDDFLSAKGNDVKWVQNCKKKAKYWKKPAIKHLKDYNWEILLLKNCTHFTSFYFPGGKIVMSSQFLEKLRTDDEIAVILGHQVAHAVARQYADYKLSTYNENKTMLEAEADYIGLLLMACAGYDPRVAPGVYKKLDDIQHGRDSQFNEFECRFADPSGEMRARLLSEPKVMKEALCMYHDAIAGRGN